MGAGSGRAGRRLKSVPQPLAQVGTHDHPAVLPAISVTYALLVGAAALAIDQLGVTDVQGPWFELLGAAVLTACALTTVVLLRTGWRRHREGLTRRGLFWSVGAGAAALVGLVAIFALIETVQISSVISGADVHVTRPVIQSLPRPPGATLLSERPGLADTESISDNFRISELKTVVPFYESALAKAGWVEDKASVGTPFVRFSRDGYVVTVAVDQPQGPGGYSVIVDRATPGIAGPPSASASPSP